MSDENAATAAVLVVWNGGTAGRTAADGTLFEPGIPTVCDPDLARMLCEQPGFDVAEGSAALPAAPVDDITDTDDEPTGGYAEPPAAEEEE